MKKTLLPILLIIPAWASFAQVFNGGFEHWSNAASFEHPVMGTTTMSSNFETYFDNGTLNVNRVDGPTGKALRMETVATNNHPAPGFFITGGVPTQDGDGMIFSDGFMVNDPNVTGVSMDMKFNVSSESPGFVIVQFKNNGNPVGGGNMGPGTFYFPIEGMQDWNNMQFDFGGPLGATPDQCVIGIVCADVLGDDQTFVVGSYIEVDNLAFIGSSDQIPGGDFETWSDVDPIWTPDDVVVDVNPFNMNVERSTIANNGMYSIKLTTTGQDGEEWVQPGRAWMAAGSGSGESVPNIMINPEHTTLSFHYWYSANDDLASAQVTFYNWDGSEWVPVHWKNIELNPNNGWEQVTYDFASELEENFTTASAMTIMFESSTYQQNGSQGQVGSILWLDDVEVSGTLNLFKPLPTKNSLVYYPNPTYARVFFDFGLPRTGFYRIFNQSGQQVGIYEFTSKKEIIHDLNGMPSGTYIFRFQHNGGLQIVQVVKI